MKTSRVLVVDDSEDMVGAFCAVLNGAGYGVSSAGTADECLRLVKDEIPDLVLLDVVLPDMSGIEVCKQIKTNSKTAGVFVIHVSGQQISAAQQAEGLEAGADGYLTKPVEPRALLAHVDALLRIKRTEQALQEIHEDLETRVAQRTAELVAANQFLRQEIAERERAEQALLAATKEWEQTFNAISDHLCIMDMSGAILRANKSMRDRFEAIHGDLIGVDYRLCYWGIAGGYAEIPCDAVLKGAAAVIKETQLPTIDGWYLMAGYPLQDSSGKQWGAVSVVRDITESKQGQERLRESEERFRLLIEGVKDYAMFMLDNDGNIISWNEGAKRIYGYELEEIVGKHFSCFYSAEQLERGDPQHELKTAKVEDRYEEEGWRVRKDGSQFWASVTVTVLRDEVDNFRGFSKVIRDITERKGTEETLRRTEETYRSIFENAIEGIFQSTPDGRFISANPAMARIFGYTSAEELMVSRKDVERQHYVQPARREVFKKLISEAGIVQGFELQAYRKDGSKIWTSENVRAVHDTGGTLLYYEGIVEDISERKKVEVERIELLRRLVRAQEDEQRRISRELHDQMGQSLAALMLGLKSLNYSGQLEAGGGEIKRLQDLTNQIAEEVHTLARDLRPIALDDLGLHTALSNYIDEWSLRSKVAADFHSNGLLMQRLPSHLESTVYRIVQESLTNVMKHANAQNVSVIVEQREKRISVIVEDDGRGFDAEALMKTPAKKRRLGLLGMQERIALVGGSVNIESTRGIGTTVLAHIPTSNGPLGGDSSD